MFKNLKKFCRQMNKLTNILLAEPHRKFYLVSGIMGIASIFLFVGGNVLEGIFWVGMANLIRNLCH